MVQYSNFNRAMGVRDHVCLAQYKHFTCASQSASKNEANSKSQMNRRNSKISKLSKMAIVVILAMLFVDIANAQLSIGGNLGINYSTINTHDNKVFDIIPKYGINIGVEFPCSFNKHFSIVPEVCIAQKGARLVSKTSSSSAFFDYYNMKLTYLEVPISLKTSIDCKNMTCFFKAGLYFNINVWTNSEEKGGCMVFIMEAPNYDRPFDYGLQGGIGVELNKKFNIQSRVYYGLYNLTNFYGPPNEYYANFVINLSVGYKFQKKSRDK